MTSHDQELRELLREARGKLCRLWEFLPADGAFGPVAYLIGRIDALLARDNVERQKCKHPLQFRMRGDQNDWCGKCGFYPLLDAIPAASTPADKYASQNPLGGPARVFEIMAERIRAGEDYAAVLADYGLCVRNDIQRSSIAATEKRKA